jgi:uncharacterized protein with HEPN domain
MTAAKQLRLPDYLEHILQAIAKIETYTAGVDQQAFLASHILQDAVIRNVEIIGEAANNVLKLDGEFGWRHPGMPLKAAYAMRNSLSHGYFLVDPLLVWGTVTSDLPPLKVQIIDVLKAYCLPSTQMTEQ